MSSSISNLSFSNILAAVRGASESERAELYALLPVPKVPAPAKEAKEAKAPAKEATKPAKAPAKAPAKPVEEDEARDKRLMGRMSKEDQQNLSKDEVADLFASAADGPGVTDTEKNTLAYIRRTFAFTEAAAADFDQRFAAL